MTVLSTRPTPATLAILAALVSAGACLLREPAAAGEPPSSPPRGFDAAAGVFVSAAEPAMRLPIPSSYRYLGRLEFTLKESAWVDRHYFAATEKRRITRMLVLQFEGLLDGVDGAYRFGIPPTERIAGYDYRYSPEPVRLGASDWVHNTWVFDQEASARESPGSESARTLELIDALGLELDAELVMSRYVRAVGPEARRELILFLMEPLSSFGLRLADLPADGPPVPALDAAFAELVKRSAAIFTRLEEPGAGDQQ